MIWTDDRLGQVAGERYVFINVENAKDYYSEYKGKKFKIPYFDEEFEKDGKKYAKDYSNAKFKNKSGLMHGVEVKEILDDKVVEQIEYQLDRIIYENTTPKSRWLNRGFINKQLEKL
jgi:hypothetical protein